MVKIPLSLNPDQQDPDRTDLDKTGPDGSGSLRPDSLGPDGLSTGGPGRIPIIGGAAVAFGILGIFTKGYIFVPLGVVCSIISLFLGQISWAFIGFLLAAAGLLTSPVLLAFLGIAWLLPW